MVDTALEVKGLTKTFGKGSSAVHAVKDISFAVPTGQTIALLGGNGAGKTTTISMLLGLLTPTSGDVLVLGHDMTREPDKVLGRINLSSPYVDVPRRLTVRENLTVYGHLYGVKALKEKIKALAEELELAGFLDRNYGTLSAGQKTRVAMAKALMNDPELLLLDEPTASLDPDTGDWIRSFLEGWRDRTGATILLASHNMAEVERLCDRVIMMREGTIVDQDTPRGLIDRFGRQNLEEVFLDIARNRNRTPGDASGDGEAAQ
ncbi:MAG: ABC transporter ATP-binding protein [Magnetovibrionaceae bacterium]